MQETAKPNAAEYHRTGQLALAIYDVISGRLTDKERHDFLQLVAVSVVNDSLVLHEYCRRSFQGE